MTRQEALAVDKDFYADEDEVTGGDYCVFGDNSGFIYCTRINMQEAEAAAEEMRKRYQKGIYAPPETL